MSQHNKVTFKDFTLSYQSFGSGERTVICLHGHGRSSNDFLFLNNRSISVLSIDLFFHENSEIPLERIDSNPVLWHEILPVFVELLKVENVFSFDVLAFSQGGRFAFLLLESMADRITTFTLIAPDGMNNQSFYNWSSRQKIFRMLFNRWQKKPRSLQRISDLSVKLKLMRPKVRDFVYYFSSDANTMKRAAQTWMAFRKLKPDPVRIGQLVKQQNIPLTIIMGKYDQVIRPQQALLFLKNAGLPQEIKVIDNGHDFFKEKSIEKFIHLLPFLKGNC